MSSETSRRGGREGIEIVVFAGEAASEKRDPTGGGGAGATPEGPGVGATSEPLVVSATAATVDDRSGGAAARLPARPGAAANVQDRGGRDIVFDHCVRVRVTAELVTRRKELGDEEIKDIQKRQDAP